MFPAMDQFEVGSKSCPDCAAPMPGTAAFCPGCGRSMQTQPRAEGRVGVFPESIAGALAYLSFLPAIVFLLLEPYRGNRFVRFHSVQCLLLWLAGTLLAIVFRLLGWLLLLIPGIGALLAVLVGTVSVLAAFLLWMVLIVKAVQGEMFKLPWIGNLAEQLAARGLSR